MKSISEREVSVSDKRRPDSGCPPESPRQNTPPPISTDTICSLSVKDCVSCSKIILKNTGNIEKARLTQHHDGNDNLLCVTIDHIGGRRGQEGQHTENYYDLLATPEGLSMFTSMCEERLKHMPCPESGEEEVKEEEEKMEETEEQPEIPEIPLSDRMDKDLLALETESPDRVEKPDHKKEVEEILGTSTHSSQVDQVTKKLSATYAPESVKKVVFDLERLILLCGGLYYDTNIWAIVTRALLYVGHYTEHGVLCEITGIIESYASKMTEEDSTTASPEALSALSGTRPCDRFELEKLANSEDITIHPEAGEESQMSDDDLLHSSLGDKSSTFQTVWETLKQKIFTKHFTYIVGTAFAFASCRIENVEFKHEIVEKVLDHSQSKTVNFVDLVDHSITVFNWVSSVGLECVRTGNFDSITFSSSVLSKCFERYYHWKERFPRIVDGDQLYPGERTVMVLEMNIVKDRVKGYMQRSDNYTKTPHGKLLRDVIELNESIVRFNKKLDFVYSAEGDHIWGKPMGGKSTITNLLHRIKCISRSVVYDGNRVAVVNLSAAFQDELCNDTQCITIDELLTVKPQFATSPETPVNLSLALIGNTPFHPNRSNLADKANVTLQHHSVCSTSNVEAPLNDIMATKKAWWRRYQITHMIVKPEFDLGGGRLNFRHPAFDDTEFPDAWVFDCYELVDNGTKEYKEFTYKGVRMTTKGLDIHQYIAWISYRTKCFWSHEIELERKHHKKLKEKDCVKCRSIAGSCVCKSGLDVDEKDENLAVGRVSGATVEQERMQTEYLIKKTPTPFSTAPSKFATLLNEDDDAYPVPEPSDHEAHAKLQSEPEGMEVILQPAKEIATNALMEWINPFNSLRFIMNVDKAVWNSTDDEVIEEVRNISNDLFCNFLSYIPEEWERKVNGDDTLVGRMKRKYINIVAANQQVIVPANTIVRRALTCASVNTFIGSFFVRALTQEAWARHEPFVYPEATSWAERVIRVIFPPKPKPEVIYTRTVANQEPLIMRGINTLFRALRGWTPVPTRATPDEITNWERQAFWTCLTTVFLTSFVGYGTFFLIRRSAGIPARIADLNRRILEKKSLRTRALKEANHKPGEFNLLFPTAVGTLGMIATGLAIWNVTVRPKPDGLDGNLERKGIWQTFFASDGRVAPAPAEKMYRNTEHTFNILKNNLATVSYEIDGKSKIIQGIFVQSKVVLLPEHFFHYDFDLRKECLPSVNLRISVGQDYKCTLAFDPGKRTRLTDSTGKLMDACVLHVARGPPVKSVVNMFVVNNVSTGSFRGTLLTRGAAGHDCKNPTRDNIMFDYVENVEHCGGLDPCRGVKYSSAITQEGTCGSPVYADRQDGAIVGIHIAGKPCAGGRRDGWAIEITSSDLQRSLDELSAQPGFLPSPEARTLPVMRAGVKFYTPGIAHQKAKIFHEDNSLNPWSSILVLGSTVAGRTMRTNLCKSIISDALTEVTGDEFNYEPANLRIPWELHNKNLTIVAQGTNEIHTEDLKYAEEDYFEALVEPLKKYKEKCPEKCRVLTLDEAINGVDGSRFMKPLDMTTSVGPPLGGQKCKYFQVYKTDKDGRKRYEFTPVLQKAWEELNLSLDSDVEYGLLSSTAMKDYLIKKGSGKGRMFYILEMVMTVAIRQHFLPVIEFISIHPLVTECAVGINCSGPEWEELISYIENVTEDRMASDEDFAHYDLSRPVNLTAGSQRIYHRIMEALGFAPRVVAKARRISYELMHPHIDWNGTLIRAFLWISGNSLTVYGNSTDNSLLHRASYSNTCRTYSLTRKKFRDVCHMSTYGDDVLDAIKEMERHILNFENFQKYCISLGMSVTRANKTSNITGFEPMDNLDFLKRKSVFVPEIGCRIGALEWSSIMRNLHSSKIKLPEKMTQEDMASDAVTMALHEAFAHGREKYDDLQELLGPICKEYRVSSKMLGKSFDKCITAWKEKYEKA